MRGPGPTQVFAQRLAYFLYGPWKMAFRIFTPAAVKISGLFAGVRAEFPQERHYEKG
jgi:hypothetical protein